MPRSILFSLKDTVTFIGALVEVALMFRFGLKLIGASAAAPFVSWVYENTEPLLKPFLYAFPTPAVRGGYVLEFTTLFAIFVYAFASYLLQELLEKLEHHSSGK